MPSQAFKPCIVIPVYNHERKIQAVIAALKAYQLPCILVDDGSEAHCAAVLDKIASTTDYVTLLRLEHNQGKGAAVCLAITKAHELGYSHALQIDADGQHNLNDIPEFLRLGNSAPKSIISGERIYSHVPKNRRYGRLLTDVWVYINTLSLSIKDSMCGYRLYPVAAAIQTMARFNIGQRMDFDTDIIVKMYWQGCSIKHVPTEVTYDDAIPSHFDLVNDNIRITKMHTALFFGMLLRLPQLLRRNLGYSHESD